MLSFGDGRAGQLGTPRREFAQSKPEIISLPSRAVQLACGNEYSVVLTVSREIWEWGAGTSSPTQLTLRDVIYVSPGAKSCVAVTASGTAVQWTVSDNKITKLSGAENFRVACAAPAVIVTCMWAI